MSPTAVYDEEGQLNIASFYDPYPKQNALHTSEAGNLLAIGGNGSGKSAFLLGEAIYVASEFPGSNSLLLRRDFPELEKGLILDFKNTVPEGLYRYNESKHVVTWLNGAKIFFGHLKNGSERALSQYLSAAFVWIGIDELGQFSYKAWEFLSSRNRINSGCQENIFGEMPICRMGGATNPLGPGYGWIKQVWVDKKPVSQMGDTEKGKDGRYYQSVAGRSICVFDPYDYVYVHSTVLDNPAQLDKDPHYIEKLQRLAPALRKKALDGDLDSVAGSYFGNFTSERNIMSLPADREWIQFQDWQPRWISIDWGLAHYCAIYWHTRALVFDPLDEKWKMRVITYREKLVNETDHEDVADLIADLTPDGKDEDGHAIDGVFNELAAVKFIFLSPERFGRQGKASTAHTIAAEMSARFKERGLPGCTKANDRRVDGAVFMYNLVSSGDWIILDNCTVLIRSIETRIRDEENLEDVLKTDDELDDAYDGARYGLLSMLKEKGKPEEVKLQEKLATIPDHTARVIYAYKHRIKEEERGKPVKPKILPRWMLKGKPQ